MPHSLRAAFPHSELSPYGEVLLGLWDEQLDGCLERLARRGRSIEHQAGRPVLVVDTENGSPFARHQASDAPSLLCGQQMNLGGEMLGHAL